MRPGIGGVPFVIEELMRVAGPDGYRLETSDVSVDLKTRQLASAGPVRGAMKLGTFTANHTKVIGTAGTVNKIYTT